MLSIFGDQVNIMELLEAIPAPAGAISPATAKFFAMNSYLRQTLGFKWQEDNHNFPPIFDAQQLQYLLEGETISDHQQEVSTPDHYTFTFSISAKQVNWRGESLIVCLFHNITKYHQLQLQQWQIQQDLEKQLAESNLVIQEMSISLANAMAERSTILQKFRKSRQFMQRLIASSPCILYIYDLDRQANLYVNQESLARLGYSADQLETAGYDLVERLIFTGDRPSVKRHLTECRHLVQGQTSEIEYRICRADQSLRWFRSYDTAFETDRDGVVHQIAGVAIDITQQKQAEQALAQSEQRNRAILGAIPALIMRLGRDGSCREFLPPRPPHRFLTVQKHISEILTPEALQRQLQAIAAAIDEQTHQVYEQEIVKFGQTCYEELYIVAVGADEVLVLVRDISDRKIAVQAQLELEREKEITQLQRRFFAMLSHEFRTPLSTILASVELLQHSHASWLDDKAKRNLNRIALSVQDALELLENMLTLSRADAGSLQIKPQYLNLRRFTEEVVDSITSERQIVMESSTSGEDYMGCIDPFLMRRVLANLLNNAIKYSPAHTLITVILLINMEQDQAIWQVIDRGIGIPQSDLPQIFLPWWRGANADKARGSGLGLSVVQSCVNAMDGMITVQSEANLGTTFMVIIPIAGEGNG